MDTTEKIVSLIFRNEEITNQIKKMVWEETYKTPFDPNVLFPWKRIIREKYNIMI